MAYNNVISRTDGAALIPEESVREIFQGATESSHVMSLARRLPDMARGQLRLLVLSVLPDVYFVGEVGRSPQTFDGIKQTTEQAWANKYINAEELAVIVPIPKNVLDDADYDIWSEMRPQISAAIGAKIDSALIFGESDVDVPANWPDGILKQMPSDHFVTRGEVGDLYDDIMAEGGVISKVEEDGFLVNGHLAGLGMRAALRSLREPNSGRPIFVSDMKDKTTYSLDGVPVMFPRNGGFSPSVASLISGDWDQLVYSIRKDVTFDIFTEGVITNNASPRVIQYNLMQDDMVALRVTFRMGWQLPNPINRVQPTEASRFPFAALLPEGSYSV